MIDFSKQLKNITNGEFLNLSSVESEMKVSFLFNDVPMVVTINLKEVGFVLTRKDTDVSSRFSIGYNRKKKMPQISWEDETDYRDLDLRVAADVIVALVVNTAIEHGLDPKSLPQFPVKR